MLRGIFQEFDRGRFKELRVREIHGSIFRIALYRRLVLQHVPSLIEPVYSPKQHKGVQRYVYWFIKYFAMCLEFWAKWWQEDNFLGDHHTMQLTGSLSCALSFQCSWCYSLCRNLMLTWQCGTTCHKCWFTPSKPHTNDSFVR